ncbi:hypothetical protein C8J57DRAFT_1461364 [Mycena rebaudengoi]|nr:hypothetical protein C8J57DRAFT_1461364 [Mycena rebaudengoi]
MRRTLWHFLKAQLTKQPPVVNADLTSKTVMVVGANTGLGFEATKHFATMNPGRVILACRSQSRGQAAVEKLKSETGYANAELRIVDLADFGSVRQFADKFEQDGNRLDYLVLNAGVANFKYEPTEDGWETSLQVNSLSTSLVALLLLPVMIETARKHSTIPRVVVVSSETHYWASIAKSVRENPDMFKTLGSQTYCTPRAMAGRYVLTKLLNIFFVRALNARLPPTTPLIVNAVNPGYCASELMRSSTGLAAWLDYLLLLTVGFPTEVGSRQLVWAALAEQEHPDALRGQYISGSRVEEVSDFVLDNLKTQDRVWDETLDILGKVDPRVTANVNKYLAQAA